MRDLHRSFPLLALALLGGCALAPRFETPQLSIVNVQVLSSDFLAQHVRVRLRVQNPNARALAVGGLTYTIEVGGSSSPAARAPPASWYRHSVRPSSTPM